MRGFHSVIFGAHFLENALPKVMGKRERVGLIAHAKPCQPGASAKIESIADNPLDALSRIHVFLRGDFVGSSLLEKTSHADVKPLGVLAKHDEIDVFFGAVAPRRKAAVKQYAEPRVHIQIQLETQAQQYIGGVNV